jgi:hypothetical protein
MARRGVLNDAERTRLFESPGDDASLIRLYSLSDADRDFVLSKRGARNQLGMAVQIGLLRYPGLRHKSLIDADNRDDLPPRRKAL